MGLCFDHCQNGGTCISSNGMVKCYCPWPYFGLTCGKTGVIEKSVGLRGDGFLEFDEMFHNLSMTFSTEEFDALLLFQKGNQSSLKVESETLETSV